MPTKSASTSKSSPAGTANLVDVIVETPRGSRNKLKYDADRRLFKLSKIGAIEAEREEEGKNKRNDRLIAVAQQSLLYSEWDLAVGFLLFPPSPKAAGRHFRAISVAWKLCWALSLKPEGK